MLKAGDIVSSSYFPEVVEIKKCESIEGFYIVESVGQDTNQFYNVMIEGEKLEVLHQIHTERVNNNNILAEDVQKYIQYRLLKNEITYSNSRALGNANIIPLPHQIEAVYGRMLQVPQVRFLLADDPGAGKTIMAGMLMKELLARYQLDKIIIFVPPLVLTYCQKF